MSLAFWTVNNTIKGLTRILCRVDSESLSRVPAQGPLILVCNHVNFLDAPMVYTHLQPRPLTGFAKSETWDNPLMGMLFNLWGAIPLNRDEVDPVAFRKGLRALQEGKIIAMAPEGTRSGNGRLQQGRPGVVYLAQHSGAPLLPLVFYGHEGSQTHWRRLRRAEFHIVVGQPFHLNFPPGRLGHAEREAITDEIMYCLAALLPEAYRGVYADLDQATTRYLLRDS